MTNEEDRERVIRVEDERKCFVTLEDGYVYYWPEASGGGMASHHLRWIADELDRRNAEWDTIIQNDPSI